MESTVGILKLLQILGRLLLVAAAAAAVMCAGSARVAAAPFQCGDAVNALVPCGPFLLGLAGEDNPSAQCCHSAQALNKMGATTELRRELCKCLTQTGPSFGVHPERADRLPPFCKLRLGLPISPTMDCNKVR